MPNKGILLNGVLIPRLLNHTFAFCFLINFDFLVPDITHFDNSIVLSLLVFEILGLMFSVFCSHFKQMIALFYTYAY